MKKNIRFIGDIHGALMLYRTLIANFDGMTIQVGDFGLGFGKDRSLPTIKGNDNWFIRGNHDNPEVCQQHPNYLGDFGYMEDQELFWAGGAESIDQELRTEGVDWWRNEQLTYAQFNEAIQLYEDKKPKIVVTHDCPIDVKTGLIRPMYKNDEWSATQQALQMMFQIYAPDLWVFGHYHPRQVTSGYVGGTKFVCIPISGVYDYYVSE